VFDPRSFNADVETVAHFTFELRAELAPEERGDVVRLYCMNRRARQVFIDRLQIRLFAEDDVGGVFALVHAPVVSGGEVAIDRAAALPWLFAEGILLPALRFTPRPVIFEAPRS